MQVFSLVLLLCFLAVIAGQGLEFFDVTELNKAEKKYQQDHPAKADTATAGTTATTAAVAPAATTAAATDAAKTPSTAAAAPAAATPVEFMEPVATTTTSSKKSKKDKKKAHDVSADAAPVVASGNSTASTATVDFLDISSGNSTTTPSAAKKTDDKKKEAAKADEQKVEFIDLNSNATAATTPAASASTSAASSSSAPGKVVLITGITGMMGSSVARELVKNQKGYKVYGMIRQRSNLQLLSGIMQDVSLILGDVTDSFRMLDVVSAIKPDIVYHFAAQSANALSYEHPQLTMTVNVHGTLNLLEALRRADLLNTKVFFAGSSASYGRTAEAYGDKPIPETARLDPVSPYGLSKSTAEEIALQYYRNYGIPVIVGRLFIYLGRSTTSMLDIQDFCRQIASVESGAQPPVVKHGNLKTIRDITNVKDAAEAIVKVTNVGKAGEVYNIGSGKGVETAGVLTSLIAMSTMAKDLTKEALTKQKQYHEKALVGDITKLTEATGFAPKLSLNETLTDELAHWRMLIKHLNIGNKGL